MNRTISAMALLAATTVVLTGCGGGSDAELSSTGAIAPDQSERCTAERAGGTITAGDYAMLPSFAPGQGMFGVRGAAQSAAVYDRLMVWNPETAEFEPKLAESLESNEDNTTWTLRLREGVTFSNGDPLTAEDVSFTIGLHQDPSTRSNAMTDAMQIEQVRVVGPRAVEFTLAEPWAGFPVLLAGVAGEVIPKKAYEASTPEQWSRSPIGAGAFTVANYVPTRKWYLSRIPVTTAVRSVRRCVLSASPVRKVRTRRSRQVSYRWVSCGEPRPSAGPRMLGRRDSR